MIETIKMDLFDAPKEALIVHGTNCLGVWGSGIARLFRDKYPKAAEEYRSICERDGKTLLGTGLIVNDSDRMIGCLFTSYAFGEGVDSIPEILAASKTAIIDMYELAHMFGIEDIYSNKFNSGLFGVPWYKTEGILLEISQNYPEINWTVCDWP